MAAKGMWKRGGALLVVALLGVASTATADDKSADASQGYAGDESCLECHAAQALTGPHGATTNTRSPAGQHSCETCHGPAAEHVKVQQNEAESDPTLEALRIGPKSSVSVEKRNAICVDCHANGNTALWDGSVHQMRDVSCVDCHSPHSKFPDYLRAARQDELCATCHKDTKVEIQRVSHHPIREGKMECSDCHNSHGSVADKLVSANTANEKCFECHAEMRGPFVWDHAPVQENCMTCHTPHGSTHEKLLTQKGPFLCQSCHSNAGHPGSLYAMPAGSAGQSPYVRLPNMGFSNACMNCHTSVHGSNSPSGKSLIR